MHFVQPIDDSLQRDQGRNQFRGLTFIRLDVEPVELAGIAGLFRAEAVGEEATPGHEVETSVTIEVDHVGGVCLVDETLVHRGGLELVGLGLSTPEDAGTVGGGA